MTDTVLLISDDEEILPAVKNQRKFKILPNVEFLSISGKYYDLDDKNLLIINYYFNLLLLLLLILVIVDCAYYIIIIVIVSYY
jgi:hypothetical protein